MYCFCLTEEVAVTLFSSILALSTNKRGGWCEAGPLVPAHTDEIGVKEAYVLYTKGRERPHGRKQCGDVWEMELQSHRTSLLPHILYEKDLRHGSHGEDRYTESLCSIQRNESTLTVRSKQETYERRNCRFLGSLVICDTLVYEED